MHPARGQGRLAHLAPFTLPCLLVTSSLALPAASWAAQPKQAVTDIDQKAFFKPELYLSSAHAPLADIQSRLPNRAAWDTFLQGAAAGRPVHVYVDPRSGAATNIIGAFPLIPGNGDGNSVTLESLSQALGRPVPAVDADVVGTLVRRFAVQHHEVLGIDTRQLGAALATQVTPDLWQVSIPQQVRGVPVRYGRLAASISHGNLVVIGTETWGNARVQVTAEVGPEHALDAGFGEAGGRTVSDVMLQEPKLEIVPVAPLGRQQGDLYTGEVGAGYEHRLVWSFIFQRLPEGARWEVLVDAQTAEVLSLQDVNHYVQRQITGGAYPVTSTEICPTPLECGTLQLNTPMPFANTGLVAPNNFTNSAGVFDWTSGTVTTTLSGRHVRVLDSCGAISASSTTGDIALGGINGQHDCTTPGLGGAGNTAASRSAFYEVNKIAEMARGWLPTNSWVNTAQLTANVNINSTCNGFWNGSTINFYRSGGGCRNTGELAGVFDHEWGHGMDDNDAAGALSNSSEGYADIAAIYRYQDSCVGHGFFWTLNDGCGMTVDGTGFNVNEAQQGAAHCSTDCSGVRDADWAKHTPNTPDTALGYVCTSCLTGTGPCGRQVHCAAAPTRQAAWDLVARDLTSAPFSYDSQTAFIIGNKLFYTGSGNVGAWHACTCGSSSSGCGATNGYMQWITADDDNGNLNDGTPHMTAIFAAFNRHGIACATPTAVNSGCASGPSTTPSLTGTPGNYQASLSWGAVAGATRYWVFRTEGHAGCNYGKAKIAEVTGTSFVDSQVANGRAYSYNVVAAGASNGCFTRASNCATVTPNGVPTPDFSVACAPSSVSVTQGSSNTTTCTVTAINGFASPVTLGCANLPSGVTCSYAPPSVTPTAGSTLTIAASGGAATGNFTIQAQGTSGALTRSANIALTVNAAPVPNFSVSCSPASLTVTQGQTSGASTCTVTSTNGFNSAVALSCAGMPSGSTCNFTPASVTPPANGSATSSLTVSATAGATTGTFGFTAQGVSGALTRTFGMSLTVNGTGGGGDLTAVFDGARQAPACNTVGRSCDTGPALVLGRANLGPETNQPNTINDSCADGTSGAFHFDESNDRIKVTSVDGGDFAAGKTVRIDATVWAWTTPSSDAADFYFTSNAASPSWTLIGTVVPTASGAQTLSATYTLPAGALQAVRVQFRYQSSNANCAAGAYNDRDDLVFAVTSAPVNNVYFDDFETATGWTTNPGGTDTATTGFWERGDPEATNDSGAKQLGTTVSGVSDLVTGRLAGASAGVHDIDTGTTSIQSPAITLPATGTLTLSFSYYLAHGSNATSADFFRVRVVGSTTTTVLNVPGAAVNRNGAWTSFSGNISAHAGQTVRILIDAADAATASLVEAGVDDVRITQQ
jgi:trimeric autotransporter adhesin